MHCRKYCKFFAIYAREAVDAGELAATGRSRVADGFTLWKSSTVRCMKNLQIDLILNNRFARQPNALNGKSATFRHGNGIAISLFQFPNNSRNQRKPSAAANLARLNGHVSANTAFRSASMRRPINLAVDYVNSIPILLAVALTSVNRSPVNCCHRSSGCVRSICFLIQCLFIVSPMVQGRLARFTNTNRSIPTKYSLLIDQSIKSTH